MAKTMSEMARLGTFRGVEVGMEVDVRSRYIGEWSRGFAVAERLRGGVRVRRTSDGALFPDVFDLDDIRLENHSPPTGW